MTSPQSICLRCLRRSLRTIDGSIVINHRSRQATFSSSARNARASPPTKKQPQTKQMTRQSPVQKHKGARVSAGKPPAPGERKAMRKRVVLSNTSALPVPGLRDLAKDNVDSTETIEGTMAGLSDATIDALRALGAFKPSQGWSVFNRPATMIRPETSRLFELMKSAEGQSPANDWTRRLIISGEAGSGKSVLQLQAIAAAQIRGWVLIHFPEAQDLSIGHTTYQPVKSEDGRTLYIQPDLTAQILARIHKANEKLLSKMQLAHTHHFEVPIQSNISLSRLVELGANDPELAYPVWQALLKELTTPSQPGNGLERAPVLLSMDGIHHIMGDSKYLGPQLKPIHAQDLALSNDFCRYLNGSSMLGNGGIVLASTSSSNRPATPTFDYLLAEKVASTLGGPAPRWDAFTVLDKKVEDAVRGVEIMQLGGITQKETKSLMEYYALSGLMRRYIANHLVGEKWSVSGGGIIGALERACVLQRI